MVFCLFAFAVLYAAQEGKDNQDWFQRWVERDVVYIISDEERDVFLKLTNDEERERFIEQFWERRNPTPGSPANDFKEEHYRRIAYANANFTAGFPGWKTDRGMIYIKFGKPDQIERNPTGGTYQRPSYEGGGQTATYPFETWRYRDLAGLGQDVEIEFVDKTLSGEYKIAMNSDEKDALLMIPNAGFTQGELYGFANKRDRILRKSNPNELAEPYYRRSKDAPFQKLANLVKLQKPPVVRFADLREVVSSKIQYSNLPFDIEAHEHLVNKDLFLVPVTMQFANKSFLYVGLNEVNQARVRVYGEVRDLIGRTSAVFEDTIVLEFSKNRLKEQLTHNSFYQKKIFLPPGRYLLNVVIKDEASDLMGTQQKALVLPRVADTLAVGSPVLAIRIDELDAQLDGEMLSTPFISGKYRIYPNVKKEIDRKEDLYVHMEVYNAPVDQTTQRPEIEAVYEITDATKNVVARAAAPDRTHLSPRGFELMKLFSHLDLPEGDYQLSVKVKDKISGAGVQGQAAFKVVSVAANGPGQR